MTDVINQTVDIAAGVGTQYHLASGELNISGSTINCDVDVTAIIGPDGTGASIPVSISDSIINIAAGATVSGKVFDFSGHAFAIDIDNLTLNALNADDAVYPIHATGQVDTEIKNSRLRFDGMGTTKVWVTGTDGTDLGTAKLNGNTIRSLSQSGLILAIGEDDYNAVTEDILAGSEIVGNIIYAPAYFDPSLNDSANIGVHAILAGNSINMDIRRNRVYGAGYGAVIKGGGTYTANGCFFNLFHNNRFGIHTKGMSDVNICNNTFISTFPLQQEHLLVGAVDWASTGIVSKNNIFATLDGTEAYNGVQIEVAPGSSMTSDNNAYIRKGQGRFGRVGETRYDTFADWVGAGYDANSIDIKENSGNWDVYLGSAPSTVAQTLSFCPIMSDGRLLNRADNPLINAGQWLSGINDGGEADPWGDYVYRLPNLGADQFAGAKVRHVGGSLGRFGLMGL
jgi:hypothetical protein